MKLKLPIRNASAAPVVKVRQGPRDIDGRRPVFFPLLLAAFLLVLPAVALHQRGVDLRWSGFYALLMSVICYTCFSVDKRRAREGEWRISERSLHLTELLGGWPGGLIAQRRFRHKTAKASYQFVFWFIVLGYQFTAIDSFQDWKFSRMVAKYMEQVAQRGDAPGRSSR